MKTICFIGCGDHAKKVYIPSLLRCLKEEPGIQLSACCDNVSLRAEAFAKAAGFPRFYTDYRAMLSTENPDAVILAVPYPLTAAIAGDAIQAGCHLLIEKPPGESYEDCERLARLAVQAECLNQVAFNRRHIPVIRQMRMHIGGEPIRHMDYRMYRTGRTENHFYSTAIHGIDLVCSLAAATCLQAHFLYGKLPQYGEGVENIFAQLAFSGGTTAQLSFCPVSGMVSEGITVTTDCGTYTAEFPVWSDIDRGSLVFSSKGNEICLPASDGGALFESNGFYWQLKSFLRCLVEGRPSPDDLKSALETMRLTDCLRERRSTL